VIGCLFVTERVIQVTLIDDIFVIIDVAIGHGIPL
jgi:hypothetical protein